LKCYATAPCEQGAQELNCFFTSGAAKCQNKYVFVSEWFILYSADQNAKDEKLTFNIRKKIFLKM